MKGPMYYCLVNSLYTMVSKMSWCTTIKELLGGVKEWDMLGVSTWKPCLLGLGICALCSRLLTTLTSHL